MSPEFWQYELLTRWKDESGFHDEPLCIGERIKKGTFRPCLREAIPFSSIVGALRESFGIDYSTELLAVGYIEQSKEKLPELGYTILAPTDVALGVAKSPAPLTIQWLRQVRGRVFVDASNDTVKTNLQAVDPEFEIRIGAMKAAGFGRCLLRRIPEPVCLDIKEGSLRSRIPKKYAERFGIEEVKRPCYGYLFEPTDHTSGIYVRSLYEGSIVKGYSFLLKGSDAP